MKKSKLIFLIVIMMFTFLACYESPGEDGWGEHKVGDGSEWQPKFFIISENLNNECELLRFNPDLKSFYDNDHKDGKGRPFYQGEPWENRFTDDCTNYAKVKKPSLTVNTVPQEIYGRVYPEGWIPR